jgi:polar amino acid transport system permease protein
VRGGLLGVQNGQRQAAQALGMTSAQSFRLVILPQAMRIIIPPTGNELIGMLKYTALASVISYNELLGTATQITGQNAKTIELLLVISFWYVVCTTALSVVQYFVERHYARGFGRGASIRKGRSNRTIHTTSLPLGRTPV